MERREGVMRCQIRRFWGKPWRRRRGGLEVGLEEVRAWMEMVGVMGMVWGVNEG